MSDLDVVADQEERILDVQRMHRERYAKLTGLMGSHGIDGLVLFGTANVQYAVGANAMTADASHSNAEPLFTVLPATDRLHTCSPRTRRGALPKSPPTTSTPPSIPTSRRGCTDSARSSANSSEPHHAKWHSTNSAVRCMSGCRPAAEDGNGRRR